MKTLHLFLMILSFTTVLAQHPDDYRWDDRFSKPGISNPEYNGAPIRGALALAANNDYVIVGGRFTVPGNNIALWNKRTLSWEKAGNGVWKNPTQYNYPEVQGLVAMGDTIVVFGRFSTAGDKPAAGFAILNTRTKDWSADTLLTGYVYDITKAGNELIVSGNFSIKGTPIRNLARLNNGQWSEFSNDTTMLPGVITEYKGALYSYVRFVNQNNYTTLARWVGNTWIPIFKTLYPAYSYYQIPIQGIKASNDFLYVYGSIDSVELSNGKMIKGGSLLRYDGKSWVTMIDSNFSSGINSITVEGNDVYVAGEFSSIQGYNTNRIAKWDNASNRWSGLGSGINGDVYGAKINALLVSDNQVYAAGQFATAGSQNVNNIARYDQSSFTWYPLGDAKTQAPNIIGIGIASVFNDMDKLLVLGDFEYAGNKRLNSIGYWTGKDWQNLGTGIIGGAGYTYTGKPRIFSGANGLTNFSRIGTTMYIGGTFEQLGAMQCENIATYNEGNSECLGGGLSQSRAGSSSSYIFPASVRAMKSKDKYLYAAGDFTRAGSLPVQSIAQWDGTSWTDMGGGINGGSTSRFILAEDSSHTLIVAGNFYQAGTVACNGLVSWDGKDWKALGYTPGDTMAYIYSMCVSPAGEILIAGYLSQEGYKGAGSLVRLKDNKFEHITDIFLNGKNNGGISVMACKGDLLYVAGGFDHIGDIEANNVAVYNLKTQKWSALGSGFVKTTTQDTVTYNQVSVQTIAFIGDTVYFGGTFTYAGGKPSFNIAAWLPAKSNSIEYISAAAATPSLSIQPNPTAATATITFTIPQAEHVSITLRDALGREVQRVSEGVLQAGEYQTHIDCSALAVGAYYCVMAGVNGVKSQMLVISR